MAFTVLETHTTVRYPCVCVQQRSDEKCQASHRERSTTTTFKKDEENKKKKKTTKTTMTTTMKKKGEGKTMISVTLLCDIPFSLKKKKKKR
jgi:galactokinase/mevalonate kinase-like predicted kinase